MSFLHFFRNNQYDSLDWIKDIYALTSNCCVVSLPEDISVLIPNENENVIKRGNSNEVIISGLCMDFQMRYILVSSLLPLFTQFEMSIQELRYISSISLRSCASLVLAKSEDLIPSYVKVFFRVFEHAIQYISVDIYQQKQFLVLFYSRFMSVNQIRGIIPYFQSVIELITNNLSIAKETFSNSISVLKILFQEFPFDIEKFELRSLIPFLALITSSVPKHNLSYPDYSTLTLLLTNIFDNLSCFVEIHEELIVTLFQLYFSLEMVLGFNINSIIKCIESICITPRLLSEFKEVQINEYIDLPTTPIMAFHNIPNMQQEVPFDPSTRPKSRGLMEFESVFKHPIVKCIQEISPFIKIKGFERLKIIVSSVIEKIKEGCIHFYVVLFLLVAQMITFQSKLSEFMSKSQYWEYLFESKIFFTEENIFTNPESEAVYLRQTFFDMVALLLKSSYDISCVRKCLIKLFNKTKHDSKMFSEILLLTFPKLQSLYLVPDIDDDLFDVLLQGTVIQEHRHILGDSSSYAFRIPTFATLNVIIQSEDSIRMIVSSSYACSALVSLLFEKSILPMILRILQLMVYYVSSKNGSKNTCFTDSLHKFFIGIMTKMNEDQAIFLLNSVLNVFFKFLKDESYSLSEILWESGIFFDIVSTILELPRAPISKEPLLSFLQILFSIQNYPLFDPKKVPYLAIAGICSGVGIDDDLFPLIWGIVSGNLICFDRVIFPEALPLLIVSAKNSSKYQHVLRTLSQLCQNSICHRYSCLLGDVPSLVLETINENTIIPALDLFSVICTYACSRKSLLAFFKVFTHLEGESLNPFFIPCISVLTSMLQKSEESSFLSFIQFSSPFSHIVVPKFAMKNITKGLYIRTRILLDSEQGGRCLFEFRSHYCNLIFRFETRGVLFIIQYGNNTEEYFVDIVFPISKWFTLSVLIQLGNKCSVFVNDNFENEITFPDLFIPKDTIFASNSVFGQSNGGKLQLQMKKVVISFIEKSLSSFRSIPLSGFSQFLSFSSQKNFDIESETKHVHRCISIPYFTNFLKIFEASHSISLVISLFAHSNLNDAYQNNLVGMLVTLLPLIFTKSGLCLEQMMIYNGFNIIGYFLLDLPESNITLYLWKGFFSIFPLILNHNHRIDFCRSIMFNFTIWQRTSPAIQIQILNDIRAIITLNPDLSKILLRLPVFLKYLYDIIERVDDFDYSKYMGVFVQIFLASSQIIELVYTLNDKNCLFHTIVCCDFPEIVEGLLHLFPQKNSIQISNSNIEWVSLFLHPSEKVRNSWLNFFSTINYTDDVFRVSAIAISSCIGLNTSSIDNNSESFLVNCCRIAIGLGADTSLGKLAKTKSFPVLNIDQLIFAFIASESDNDIIKSLFWGFLDTTFRVQDTCFYVSQRMTTFHLFFILHWAFSQGSDYIDFIGKIIVHNSSLFKSSIFILDIYSINSGNDISVLRSHFIQSVIQHITSLSFEYQSEILKIAASAILYHHKSYSSNCWSFFGDSLFESNIQGKPFPCLSQFMACFLSESFVPPKYIFSLCYNDKFEWIDADIAQQIIFHSSILLSKEKIDLGLPIVFLLYCCFVVHPTSNCVEILTPILGETINILKNNESSIPTLYQCVSRPEARTQKNSLLSELFDQCSNRITIQHSYLHFISICSLFESDFSLDSSIIIQMFSSMALYRKLYIPLSPDVFDERQRLIKQETQHVTFVERVAEHHWKRLWQDLILNHSHILGIKESQSNHYKRGNMTSNLFLPMILKRNTDFNNHNDASRKTNNDKDDLTESAHLTHFHFKHESCIHDSFYIKQDGIKLKASCEMIKIDKTVSGVFYIRMEGIVFVSNEGKAIQIGFNEINYVFWQWLLHRPTAIEVFTMNNRSYFFNFPELDDRSPVIRILASSKSSNTVYIQTKHPSLEIFSLGLIDKWKCGEISNFEYLLWVNQFSGRSFNNPQAYPIFPWILADYTTEHIDLNNPKNFRDLSKPIGALNSARLERLKENVIHEPNQLPILYRSSYSCPFHVFYFLIRLEPYTSLHIQIQDGRFDVPSRLFSSIPAAWESVNNISNNFRELIPEFFFLPDFVKNKDKFYFGSMSDGTKIDHVELPKWASSPEEFTNIHRDALESDFVSQNLHNWIDLIFGAKQTGQLSIDNDNVFDSKLYSDVWQKYNDPYDLPEIEALLLNVGAIPIQIFNTFHEARQIPSNIITSSPIQIILDMKKPVLNINYHNDKKQLSILLSDGALYQYNFHTYPQQIFDPIPNRIPFSARMPDGLFAYTLRGSTDVFVHSQNITRRINSKHHIDSITCISALGSSRIITGGKDSLISSFSIESSNNDIYSLMAHSDVITCCFASESHGVVASCSADGILIISQASNFSIIRSIYLDLPHQLLPQRVFITEGRGHIIVFSGHLSETYNCTLISVYSINGVKISEERFPIPITEMEVASNQEMKDYLILSNHENNIMLYDAFSLKLIEVIYRCQSKVSSIFYSKKSRLLVFSLLSGKIMASKLFNKVFK